MKLCVLALLVACKSEPPTLRLVAEVPGDATLVTGTRRIALRTATSWFVHEGGKLVDKPEIAAAITKLETEAGGVVDVFLGTTPIVSGGEEHHEKHVRIPAGEIDLHGVATEVVTVGDREAWRYEHELRTQIAFVTGTQVEEAPALERIGPDAPGASPVSARLCRHPKIVDLAASPTTIYALVTECSDDAPVRVVAYAGGEQRLPSVTELGFRPEAIAVSRRGKITLVGVRDKQLATYRDAVATHTIPITRIVSAVVADDDRLWVLGLDHDGYRLSRDSAPMEIAALAPKALGLDDTLGVVVLFAGKGTSSLYAFSR